MISLAPSDEGDSDSDKEIGDADSGDVGSAESGSEGSSEDAKAEAEAEIWDRGSQASTTIEDATDQEEFATEYGEPTHAPVTAPVTSAKQQGSFWVRPIYCVAFRY